jgi:hypothetical protein
MDRTRSAAAGLLVALSLAAFAAPAAEDPSIPMLAQWQAHMVDFGRKHAAALAAHRDDADVKPLIETLVYYDAARVYQQIGAYTGDPAWKQAALDAIHVYRDRWVIAQDGNVFGHQNFSHGMLMHWQATGDAVSRDTILKMSKLRWMRDENPIPVIGPGSCEGSRETAYAIETLLDSQTAGGPPRAARLALLVDGAISHYDQWFVSRTATYVRPFMAGLTAEALIDFYEATRDPRVLPTVKVGMEWLWQNLWVPEAGAFRYTDIDRPEGGREPAADLNLLIAPAFAWLWRQTGDPVWRERGDQIFAGGVKGAYIEMPKQFYQSYRWSFAYVEWRSQPPVAHAVAKAKKPAAAKPPAKPAADVAPQRQAITAALADHGRWPVSLSLSLFAAATDVVVEKADASGATIRGRDGIVPLRWQQIVDLDLARLCLQAVPDDADALAEAWRLARAIDAAAVRDAIGYRLLAIDAARFRSLSGEDRK